MLNTWYISDLSIALTTGFKIPFALISEKYSFSILELVKIIQRTSLPR